MAKTPLAEKHLEKLEKKLSLFQGGKQKGDSILVVDYPVSANPRWPAGKPNPTLKKLLAKTTGRTNFLLSSVLTYEKFFHHIPADLWENDFFPPLDAMVLYSALTKRKPSTYLEIGSGFSTFFARRAISDHGLKTKIVSIDPNPRSSVEQLVDKRYRKPLEDLDLTSITKLLKPNDIVLFDGTHRSFQNSDVTVFFNEFLWSCPKGTLICIHDIFLPFDYPRAWNRRYYNEQFILAAILLAESPKIRTELATYYAYSENITNKVLRSLWKRVFGTNQNKISGGGFWFSRS